MNTAPGDTFEGYYRNEEANVVEGPRRHLLVGRPRVPRRRRVVLLRRPFERVAARRRRELRRRVRSSGSCCAHPAVRSAAVYAVPDDPVGDRVMVAVEVDDLAGVRRRRVRRLRGRRSPTSDRSGCRASCGSTAELPKLASMKLDKTRSPSRRMGRRRTSVGGPERGEPMRPMTPSDVDALAPPAAMNSAGSMSEHRRTTHEPTAHERATRRPRPATRLAARRSSPPPGTRSWRRATARRRSRTSPRRSASTVRRCTTTSRASTTCSAPRPAWRSRATSTRRSGSHAPMVRRPTSSPRSCEAARLLHTHRLPVHVHLPAGRREPDHRRSWRPVGARDEPAQSPLRTGDHRDHRRRRARAATSCSRARRTC